MRRRDALTGLAAAAVFGRQAMADEATNAVSSIITRYQDCWNASDLDGMAALYRPDVHWVNVVGMHWRGLGEVDRAHRIYFDLMFRGVRQRLEGIEDIRFPTPDVAIAVARWRVDAYRTPAGHVIPEGQTRMTLVFTREGDGWKIIHGANIDISAEAAHFDPIRGSGGAGMGGHRD